MLQKVAVEFGFRAMLAAISRSLIAREREEETVLASWEDDGGYTPRRVILCERCGETEDDRGCFCGC